MEGQPHLLELRMYVIGTVGFNLLGVVSLITVEILYCNTLTPCSYLIIPRNN